ncbi:MAG TPA: PH domain-containing protein [Stellaceae bacterium]|nr:PH domain-containing protein [Stellaceae bacterium]
MPAAMSYVTRVLQPGERVVHDSTLHWVIFTRAIVAAIICLVLVVAAMYTAGNQTQYLSLALWIAAAIFALLGLAAGLRAFVRRATTEFAVTDHRVIYKTGLLARHTLEMNRSKVESVDVNQSIPGRFLGYGTVIVRGTGGSLEPIRNVADPLMFRSHITAGDQGRL